VVKDGAEVTGERNSRKNVYPLPARKLIARIPRMIYRVAEGARFVNNITAPANTARISPCHKECSSVQQSARMIVSGIKLISK
jgi:hypothetical protein